MKESVIQDKTSLSPAKQLLLEKRLRGESVVASKVRPPLRPMVRPEAIPLSFAQKRLWFLHKLEGPNAIYNMGLARRLEGKLNEAALKAALHDLIIRHETLRTIIPDTADVPGQKILDAETIDLDLNLQEVEEADLACCLDQAARHNFNLTCEIPLRVWLFRLAPERHVLLLLLHHIACDGASLAPLWSDLTEAYGARERGESPKWTPLPVQYADYALWQQELLGDEADASSAIARQRTYWQQMLAGLPDELDVPKDWPRPVISSYRGESIGFRIEPGLHQKLLKLAREAQATVYMVLQAGLAALLTRLGAGTDIPLGSAIEGRMDNALNRLVGFFVNTLVLRTDTSANPSFRELLARVRKYDLTAYAHQDLPFERLVEVLNPTRSLNRHPLFQVMLALQSNEVASFNLPGLKIVPEAVDIHVVKFDLAFNLVEQRTTDGLPQGIIGSIRYATDLFKPATVEVLGKRLIRMLEAAVANPEHAIGNIDLLETEERQQILYEWNETKREYQSEQCVHELFEEQVERTPEAIAMVFEDEELSYGELNRRANRLAHYLRELGVKPDSRVAICVERSMEMIVGLLGVLKAGGAYVPLDPAYPRERLSYMLEDCAPVVVLTQRQLREVFSELNPAVAVVDLAEAPAWQQQPDSNIDRASIGLTSQHMVYVIYTSGSTGRPKGVMVEHHNLSSYLLWSDEAYYRQTGYGSPAIHSIGFDGLVTTLYGPLICGQTLTLPRQGTEMEIIVQRSAESLRYTLVKVTPSHLKILNQAIAAAEESKMATQALMIGGEALVPADIAYWQQRFPGVRLVNHYGPTETTVGSCTFEITAPVRESSSIPIGRPIANARMYILDGEGEPVPVGVAGEIYIGGAGVARGYLNRAELTAERFVADPYAREAGARMYKTGDLGRWLGEGNIECLGRNDSQVKIRGFRIELEEIEARLTEHVGVQDAVVIAREDEAGDKRLVAYYTCVKPGDGSGESVGTEVLRGHLAAQLPEYMVPAAYVRMERLPLTPNGKLDRKALPAPESDAYAVHEYEPPQGEIETQLAAIWAELLKLERVGRQDNFFSIGGHSLLVVRVIERMRRIGLEVDVRTLFATPTLIELAAAVKPKISDIVVPPNRIPEIRKRDESSDVSELCI